LVFIGFANAASTSKLQIPNSRETSNIKSQKRTIDALLPGA
jgi:hypothetical protein